MKVGIKTYKDKKCKACGKNFTPSKQFQVACDFKCAIIHSKNLAKNNLAKKKRKETKIAREKLKTRSDYLAEAQIACNAYVRYRDRHKPCISCGTTNPNIQYAAGHYRTRGACPELRFHPMNIHRQCNKRCNSEKSGNIGEYRPKLIEKIGIKNLEWIEGPHKIQNLTIEDAIEIKIFFKEQLKILKNNDCN